MLESGKRGFTNFLLKQGLKPLVAGADGKYYEQDQWYQSKTFRVPGGQSNLLVEDNQTKAYDMADPTMKKKMEIAAWGRFLNRIDLQG
jgi:hypothetical protein